MMCLSFKLLLERHIQNATINFFLHLSFMCWWSLFTYLLILSLMITVSQLVGYNLGSWGREEALY